MTNDHKTIIRESLADADLFARAILRLDLHEWQGRLLHEASKPGRRRRIAARAPNGAGKDDRIIVPLALWWLRRYRRGQVVITTADEKQLSNQTWVSLSAHKHLFGDCPTWRDHDHIIVTPTGGRLSAFVTDEAKRSEGYHEHPPDGPLLMIVNEAKSVEDDIFDAFNRCSYNLLLEISTGGLMQGRFYDHMTHKRELYETFEITLKDCPHISPEKISQIIQEYGENDPYTRSTIYGEFMATDDRIRHVLELADIESSRRAEIGRLGGTVSAGIDFAGGGDSNVILKRTGNYVPNGCIKAWRERDTHAAIGRYIAYLIEMELHADQVWADADGLGLPMCDSLAAAGWKVNRFYGGIAAWSIQESDQLRLARSSAESPQASNHCPCRSEAHCSALKPPRQVRPRWPSLDRDQTRDERTRPGKPRPGRRFCDGVRDGAGQELFVDAFR